MKTEQRRFARKRTDQLLYAEFGPDNGSVLLNLSEDGCSFQSIAPVREQQVSFSLSVGDGRKLVGHGQMVWSDTAKKVGGLRFLNPSPKLREQVREWLEEKLIPSKDELYAAAVESDEKRRRSKPHEARAEAQLGWKQVTSTADKAKASRSDALEFATPLKSLTVPISVTGTRRVAGGIVLAAMLIVALIAYRRELGHLMMSFGSNIAGEEQGREKRAPTDIRAVDAAGLVTKPEAKSTEVKADVPEATGEGVVEATSASSQQLEESAKAPTPAVKRVSVRQAVVDVSALWSSVENGDTGAEVTLANRYLRGEGVPQSCAQARVLLEAAVKRGSAEGRQKLGELGQAGCP